MLTPDGFERLVDRVKELERIDAQLDGSIDQVMSEAEQEFGVRTLAEIEQVMTELQDQRAEALTTYNRARTAFDKQWAGKL